MGQFSYADVRQGYLELQGHWGGRLVGREGSSERAASWSAILCGHRSSLRAQGGACLVGASAG